MKTVGKVFILLGVGLPILALLNCIGWDIFPNGSFLLKARVSYVELRPAIKTPEIVHREIDSFSNALKTIESTAFEKYPPALRTNSTVNRKSMSPLDLFEPNDENEYDRIAFIRSNLIRQGYLTPERTYPAFQVKVRTVFVFGLLMTLAGVFLVWK